MQIILFQAIFTPIYMLGDMCIMKHIHAKMAKRLENYKELGEKQNRRRGTEKEM